MNSRNFAVICRKRQQRKIWKTTFFAVLSRNEKSGFDFWINESVIDGSGLLKELAELEIGSNEDKTFNINNRQIPLDPGTKDEEGQYRRHCTKGYREIEFDKRVPKFLDSYTWIFAS